MIRANRLPCASRKRQITIFPSQTAKLSGQGFVTRKRMYRAFEDGTGVLSRTTSWLAVLVTITVFGEPETQLAVELPETSTI